MTHGSGESGYHAVPHLLGRYAEAIDGGDLGGASELFAHATITSEVEEREVTGADAARAPFESRIRLCPDGAPHTKHATTNLVLEVGDENGTGTCRSYVTVFQAADELPLQPVFSGHYHDTFERVDDVWRFSRRHMLTDHVGDLSRHLLKPL